MINLKKVLNPNKLSTGIFYFSILLFIIAFGFAHNPAGGWYQQFMPNLGGRPLTDITFTDSLTGYATASNVLSVDTSFILKTTNGGDNWNVILAQYRVSYHRVIFLNNYIGYAGGSTLMGGFPYLIKTTNGGINWSSLNTPGSLRINDMAILNEDTIWITDANGFDGGIFRTTNGGTNWTFQFQSSSNLERIYMYNKDIGFASSGTFLFKTTNSGLNWNMIPGQNGYNDVFFIDSITGWKSYDSMRITTDGGISWRRQYLPEGGFISNTYHLYNFANINEDTIWGSGGVINYPGNSKGFLYRTTNGGENWSYQVPDTSFGMRYYEFINFVNYYVGWSYTPLINRGIHTTVGGDTSFITNIKQLNSNVLNNFTIFQNYPNPFNPKTKINFELQSHGRVKLTVYDIMGKEIITLINEQKQPGKYEVDFDGSDYHSGVYFYKLEISDVKGNFSDTKRMLLIK